MKLKSEFVFKCVEYKDAGSFTNDSGQVVKYKDKYILKVDEITEKGINSIEFVVPVDSHLLVSELKRLAPYDKISLELEIVIYRNGCRLVPLSVEKSQSSNK